jgi:hypothetical protein
MGINASGSTMNPKPTQYLSKNVDYIPIRFHLIFKYQLIRTLLDLNSCPLFDLQRKDVQKYTAASSART